MRIERCRKKRDYLRARVERLRRTNPDCAITQGQLQNAINAYLNSASVQLATFHEIWSRRHGALMANLLIKQRCSPEFVALDYKAVEFEPVAYQHRCRSTSGFRRVCKLPDDLLMFHYLARDLIVAQFDPKAHIADWKGRGANRAIERMAEAINQPDQQVIVADISRCFDSVNFNEFYKSSLLPEEFIRRALDCRYWAFRYQWNSKGCCHPKQPRCKGPLIGDQGLGETVTGSLGQGSPASNAVLATMLNDMDAQQFGANFLAVISDNIIVVCAGDVDPQPVIAEMVEHFANHRYGPFVLHPETIEARPASEPFDFLGYQFRCAPDGALDIDLSQRNWEKLNRLLENGRRNRRAAKEFVKGFSKLGDARRVQALSLIIEKSSW